MGPTPGSTLRPVPTVPAPTPWLLPWPTAGDDELIGAGADLEPGTLLTAYARGLFPMPLERGGPIGWWSPEPRAVLPIDGMRVSRSLRRSMRTFEIRIDTAFEAVVAACADPSRPHGWIDQRITAAYTTLHAMGWAHSVETWADGRLVGGLYGVNVGAFFAGESMFHRATDASKVALVALVDLLRPSVDALLDVQWLTPHLASLGAVEIGRDLYLHRLGAAIRSSPPGPFGPTRDHAVLVEQISAGT